MLTIELSLGANVSFYPVLTIEHTYPWSLSLDVIVSVSFQPPSVATHTHKDATIGKTSVTMMRRVRIRRTHQTSSAVSALREQQETE